MLEIPYEARFCVDRFFDHQAMINHARRQTFTPMHTIALKACSFLRSIISLSLLSRPLTPHPHQACLTHLIPQHPISALRGLHLTDLNLLHFLHSPHREHATNTAQRLAIVLLRSLQGVGVGVALASAAVAARVEY